MPFDSAARPVQQTRGRSHDGAEQAGHRMVQRFKPHRRAFSSAAPIAVDCGAERRASARRAEPVVQSSHDTHPALPASTRRATRRACALDIRHQPARATPSPRVACRESGDARCMASRRGADRPRIVCHWRAPPCEEERIGVARSRQAPQPVAQSARPSASQPAIGNKRPLPPAAAGHCRGSSRSSARRATPGRDVESRAAVILERSRLLAEHPPMCRQANLAQPRRRALGHHPPIGPARGAPRGNGRCAEMRRSELYRSVLLPQARPAGRHGMACRVGRQQTADDQNGQAGARPAWPPRRQLSARVGRRPHSA